MEIVVNNKHIFYDQIGNGSLDIVMLHGWGQNMEMMRPLDLKMINDKNNKKVSEKDNRYFEMAEKYLYNEMAIVLNMTPEDVRNYVIEQVSK